MSSAVQPGIAISVRRFVVSRERAAQNNLLRNDVHVWLLGPNEVGEDLSGFWTVLSPDEIERAARFRFEGDRAQYVRTRGSLRLLLGSYLELPAREILFSYTKNGKPGIVGQQGRNVEFNVSHTKGMAILGFTRGCRIGVDVEGIRTDFQTSEIAERFFSFAEREALREIAPEHRHQAFFRIWTRKEAYIKALGEGLSHPLHQFDVSLGDAARLISTRPDATQAQRWWLENVTVSADFAAAVAIETAGALSGDN
jgi:4'-phosphopantetheinyl transferase